MPCWPTCPTWPPSTSRPEIALYEPPDALFGGPDGLALIRRLVASSAICRLVALEVGPGQAAAVAELLREAGFAAVERRRDLAGHERVVVGGVTR